MSLDPGLLEILACPRCKGRLLLTPGGRRSGLRRCRVAYPVTDDIPVMIFEEAVPWTPGGRSGAHEPGSPAPSVRRPAQRPRAVGVLPESPCRPACLRGRVGAFSGARVLVVGDLMVDRYYAGVVRRISPEAPVPVVEVAEETQRFGGAANVAHNLRRLGAAVEVCGVVGDDAEGGWLREQLGRAGIGVDGIQRAPRPPDHPQVPRRRPPSAGGPLRPGAAGPAPRGGAARRGRVPRGGLAEDRRRGHLRLRQGADPGRADGSCPRAQPREGDPPGRRRPQVAALRALPARDGDHPESGRRLSRPRGWPAVTLEQTVEKAGAALLRSSGGSAILITRGEAGMSLFQPGREPLHIPTVAREVFDVTGAGDTVVGVLALALGRRRAPAAGGAACEHRRGDRRRRVRDGPGQPGPAARGAPGLAARCENRRRHPGPDRVDAAARQGARRHRRGADGGPRLAPLLPGARRGGRLVATDDERIRAAVRAAGGRAVLTAASHVSGTDRIAEAVRGEDCDLVVNVQGDEPFVEPGPLEALVAAFAGAGAARSGHSRHADPRRCRSVQPGGGEGACRPRRVRRLFLAPPHPVARGAAAAGPATARRRRRDRHGRVPAPHRHLRLPPGVPAALHGARADVRRAVRAPRAAAHPRARPPHPGRPHPLGCAGGGHAGGSRARQSARRAGGRPANRRARRRRRSFCASSGPGPG